MLFCAILVFLATISVSGSETNVIFILADDLGYGDLGWAPFDSREMKNVRTPNLQRMAKNGMILTNFHAASPICSPSRAAIMTGLFPWRMGVDFIYSQDPKKDGTEELDHEQLPLIPNIAMAFQHHNYYTAHIGKWHLGGISQFDIPNRKNGNCTVPGINQYGFDEYVAMTEHMYSARYWTQQRQETYAKGANFLFRNDEALPSSPNPPILTDKQTTEAIRVIREQTRKGKPFFVNLWYDAPHSPWEAIQPFYGEYVGKFATDRLTKYASMISNMDMNIGRVLDTVEELGIAENTLIIFTSDNGPEEGAGSPGPFRGRKRYLNEGGIRVPTLAQWKGKIVPGSKSDRFAVNTDLFPTFMDAIGKSMPSNIRIDGMSFLPMLLEKSSTNSIAVVKRGDERVVLWYTHCLDYPKFTAAWSHGYKIIWYDYEGRKSKNLPAPWRVFNTEVDPTESNNLLPLLSNHCGALTTDDSTNSSVVNWNQIHPKVDIANQPSKEQSLQILKLLRYLQQEMYYFRYDGEYDWLLYHENRPAESGSHCQTRRLYQIDSLPWSSHVNLPKHCGASLVEEAGFGCGCEFASCSKGWYQVESTWVHDTFLGLTHFSPMKGSLQHYLQSMLEWTSFQDICPGLSLVSNQDATQRSSEKRVEKKAKVYCSHQHHDLSPQELSPKSSSSNGFRKKDYEVENLGYSRGDFIGNDWSRSCHSRVHYNHEIKQYYLSTATCAYDKPIVTINFHSIPRPIHICPESFQHLMNADKAKNYVDDQLFVAISYASLLPKHLTSKDGDSKASTGPSSFHRDVGIIDPLFVHFLSDNDNLFDESFQLEDAFRKNSLKEKIDKLWSLVADHQHRLRVECTKDCISYLLIPAFYRGAWSVVIVYNIRSSEGPSMVYYCPSSFGKAHKRESAANRFGQAMKVIVSGILAKLSPNIQFNRISMQVVETTEASPSPALDTFKLLHFTRLLLESLRNPSIWGKSSPTSIATNIKKEEVVSFRKKIMSFIVQEGKSRFQARKDYITKMSKPRYS